MKYLKEYSNYESYTKIDGDGIFNTMLLTCTGLFADKEYDVIRNIFPNLKVKNDYDWFEFDDDEIRLKLITISNYGKFNIAVFKEPDEWYYVKYIENHYDNLDGKNLYYKCDQLNGLKECLEMLKNKYNI